MPTRPRVIFSHGKDGEPWGAKIIAMAEIVKGHSLAVESVDYRGMDDPGARVERLLQLARTFSEPLVLVGSSLGGHVATAVASQVNTAGLFLLAPAFFMPGYEQYTPVPPACPIWIVHGWRDDVVPVDNSYRFAKQYRAQLHVLDSDHRLTADIDRICTLFDTFLTRVTQ